MIRYFDRLKKFDFLIRHGMTGSPKECAQKLEISKSRFYEFLEELDLLDIPVEYDRSLKTYVYSKSGKLKLGFEEELNTLDRVQLSSLQGGKTHLYLKWKKEDRRAS
ncbi:MAG: hypothetical protein R2799_03620 [Crocinitomicaceae bacterium]